MSFIYEINVMECLKATYDVGKKNRVINQQVCEKRVKDQKNRKQIKNPFTYQVDITSAVVAYT